MESVQSDIIPTGIICVICVICGRYKHAKVVSRYLPLLYYNLFSIDDIEALLQLTIDH